MSQPDTSPVRRRGVKVNKRAIDQALRKQASLAIDEATGEERWFVNFDGVTYVFPLLTPLEEQAVQRKFTDVLEFGEHRDGKEYWTTITPYIGRREYKLVVAALSQDVYRSVGKVPVTNTKEGDDSYGRWTPTPLPVSLKGYTAPPVPQHATGSKPVWAAPEILVHPYVMNKLMFMTHANGGRTEIGGFGIGSQTHVMTFRIDDFYTVPHSEATGAYHEFDLVGVHRDFIDPWLDRHPETPADELMAFWFHSHPGNDATPSSIDWGTMNAMSITGYRFMLITGKGGALTAHVRYHTAFGSCRTEECKVRVDYSRTPELPALLATHAGDWQAEYDRNVLPAIKPPAPTPAPIHTPTTQLTSFAPRDWHPLRDDLDLELIAPFDTLAPTE